jgi:hypothetical protein
MSAPGLKGADLRARSRRGSRGFQSLVARSMRPARPAPSLLSGFPLPLEFRENRAFYVGANLSRECDNGKIAALALP